ncbi:MAG TPA: HlyD family secretion protein [Beijerinckiaceae bacterium]|nr:HlyD family secretion protein [Beijerinckiaceae bacterium]
MSAQASAREQKPTIVELREPSGEKPSEAPHDRRESPAVAAPPPPAPVEEEKKGGGRRPLRMILMLGGVIAVLIGAGYYWVSGGRYVSSDDSYVHAAKLMVSTDVSGLVRSVDVKQGQAVAMGQVLFQVDPSQYRIALNAAEANLAQVRLSLTAAVDDYKRLQSDIAAQGAQVDLAQANFNRAASLMRANAGTKAAYDQARFTLAAAQKTLESLKVQAQVALARLGGSLTEPIQKQPQYLQAKAQVEEAQRQLNHTIVRAPFAGDVTGVDSLEPGTFLVSQTAALTNTGAIGLVSTSNVWVDVNIKETGLTYLKVGDPVQVTIDAFPGRTWSGHVESIYPATGSEFSILPAENASGNWVKVVQRIAVRVAIDVKPGDPPLRAGLSANVDIDTGHKRHWSELWQDWLPGAKSKDGVHGVSVH